MKENNTGELWVSFVIGFVVALILTVNLQSWIWEGESIDRGFAYYHPITAKFTWKTNMVEINK